MEQKSVLLSALSVGVGVGIGLAASGQSVGKWGANTSSNALTPQNMEREMLRLVVDGRESDVTFDQFPYYLRYSFPQHDFLLHFISLSRSIVFPSFLC